MKSFCSVHSARLDRYHVDYFLSDVSSHHATDSLSKLANQKPAFVGERCILKNPGVSCRLSFSSLFPSPLSSIFRAPKEFRKQTFSILTQPKSRLAG